MCAFPLLSFRGLAEQVQVIAGAYVQLEDAYCLRSVEEAMRIAEPIEVCSRHCTPGCGAMRCDTMR